MVGQVYQVEKSAFVDKAVNWIETAVNEILEESRVCHLMLAGGGTPLPVYAALAEKSLPWNRIAFYFGDERCVPPDDPNSNFRAITESLFPQGIPDEIKVYRMHGEDNPAEAAQAYTKVLPDRVDIVLLGMGGDGHTASLFPGSPVLDETEKRVMPVIGSKPPPQRLTITPPVILAARKILMMVEGENKAVAVKQALEKGDAPAALARQGDWLLDEAAASALSD